MFRVVISDFITLKEAKMGVVKYIKMVWNFIYFTMINHVTNKIFIINMLKQSLKLLYNVFFKWPIIFFWSPIIHRTKFKHSFFFRIAVYKNGPLQFHFLRVNRAPWFCWGWWHFGTKCVFDFFTTLFKWFVPTTKNL